MRILRPRSVFGTHRVFAGVLLILLGLVVAPTFSAQMVQVEGTVQDADSDPVVGARVVYRLVDTDAVFISAVTDGAGRYILELPSAARCYPVAVIVASGTRVELGDVAPVRAADGMSQQITIDVPRRWNPSAVVQYFPGSDRLFRSLAEDTAIVERYRLETQIQRQEGDVIDRGLMNVIGVAHFAAIPSIEFGARLSVVGINTTSGRTGDGLGDTDLWVKSVLGATSDNRHELAFGAIATLPTGTDSDGTGFDSTRSKLFVAARRELSWGVLTGNLGVAFNGDGRFFDFNVTGETAPSVNVGVIVPWTYRLVFIGEVGFEGERFRGIDDQAIVLGGVNVMLKEGSIRGALGLGFSDGSPDVELTAGYAFHF